MTCPGEGSLPLPGSHGNPHALTRLRMAVVAQSGSDGERQEETLLWLAVVFAPRQLRHRPWPMGSLLGRGKRHFPR